MIVFFICLCLSFKQTASGDCFWIDGTVAKGHTAGYDLNSVGASMCCAQDSPSFTSFLPGGICQYQNTGGAQGPHDNGSSFWRDSCSDRTWQDPACLAMAPCRSIKVALTRHFLAFALLDVAKAAEGPKKANTAFFFFRCQELGRPPKHV